MPVSKKILFLAGDGIGPEVMAQVRRVMDWLNQTGRTAFEVEDALVGGAAYDAQGTPLHDDTVALALAADAVLLGAVGGPKWDASLPFELKPERGLLRLRKDLELFANLRPAMVFDALAEASTLKTELVSGLDVMIVRELTGGVYFGQPRGISALPNGERRGVNTQVYDTHEIVRVAKVAFDLAGKRGKRLCSVEKANVMESGLLWREEVTKLGADYPEIALSHMYADNCAMQLVRQPKQFDVIVTDNLFGDILSDCAAMLTGSLGMLPSASLGAADAAGNRRAMYEPVHGSAPDIAGQDKANPLATILSFSMMLRYSFDLAEEADLVDNAVRGVLAKGLRTGDIFQPGKTLVGTTGMGDALLAEMAQLAN
ncbi:3-isopropylmalate dehydrogenase [Rhodospirillum rubrum]|uniref:3-isopropylmalate dehydrogenase n=1 Tax=Rhodospirillum rubrum (strain ATCC 11170 / ATH 1.1.1 / DSM 467 / LMG 4362 / NCIMB 8255 / S1) TaxID=269796 RepID=LEU3_RHORT|nr:3-isopropylmalate dehydrogenase [Rhodospirillum rubrum]Q2RV53.1 RecName: Full=3-isopropylmalate dehydrogenase; AltName: Full=3-IPM-DH; AltName: Full=Beta-IPM dehydrogenase; Short=IMDH [Rhodospirillum rubrum ATCC 11170]ABC21992.1 3-isopropylmalate dehydrogenase [Rhodospirillum rubrum ATCC 11170]AEO47704.1 3-isopropylmalate dehydrogenase [Rhodospirillum rubrum F11]MBK5953573.1 3-isopropylmalate dehydrogenase [Rhodospirillum rubrum]QXG81648.1 3-isopropylmalate dehydrogenase [Rhodospirillum rub